MAKIKRFEDIECWQEARKLIKIVYSFPKKDEFKKDYELIRQVRKSFVSSMGNIAEGFHRNSLKTQPTQPAKEIQSIQSIQSIIKNEEIKQI